MTDRYGTASLYAIMWSYALETLAERSQASLESRIPIEKTSAIVDLYDALLVP